MPHKQTQRREPDELPLAHDAATWDEDSFESNWDDDNERLIQELARSANS